MVRFDEIGEWSEIKLEIVRKYAAAYSGILASQRNLYHLYIDAFAGAGVHIARSTGTLVLGSPLNALAVEPPFRRYVLIDIERDKIASLLALVGSRPDVELLAGDCNKLLLDTVFPQVDYRDFRRALCLLDPYGLHLDWNVIARAGGMKSIEIFLNFPVADINRNVLWEHPEGADPADLERMTRFWGDESWRRVVYTTQRDLFGDPRELKTGSHRTIADAFRRRLTEVAGFKHVPEPLAMRNSQGAIVYYLFFASPNDTGDKIVREIFQTYRR